MSNTKPKRRHSLRLTVLSIVGLVLTVFAILFFAVFRTSMNNMLLKTEEQYLLEQHDTVLGIVQSGQAVMRDMTMDIALWRETEQFILGENPDYIRTNWPDVDPLENYRFSLMIIKDRYGNDLYEAYRDNLREESLPLPAGLSDSLNSIVRSALEEYDTIRYHPDVLELVGEEGLFFFDGQPYYVCTMPVAMPGEGGDAVGTLTFGNRLDDLYFKRQTSIYTMEFAIESAARGTVPEGTVIRRVDEDTMVMQSPIQDYYGRQYYFSMSRNRSIFSDGLAMLRLTSAMLLLLVVLLIGVLYFMIARRVVLPVESLSKDIAQIAAKGEIEPEKYSESEEFVALGNSINDMLERLHQSNISMDAFKRIFNGIDAHIYVSDPYTDEMLFFNNRLSEAFGLEEGTQGLTCHQVLRQSDKRCEHCPNKQLLKNPDQNVVWESYNPITKRYYANTDCLIEWTDQKLVHLQHCIDITKEKETALALQRRLEQQELMSAVSQSFISTQDTGPLISNALRMTGEFMDVERILLCKYNEQNGRLEIETAWYDEEQTDQPIGAPIIESEAIYEALVLRGESAYMVTDTSKRPHAEELNKINLKAYVCMPLYIAGTFWGVLCMDECSGPREWTQSDALLLKLITNVIAGVLARSETEAELLRMSAIVNSSPEFIAEINSDGTFRFLNKGAVEASRYSYLELIRNSIDKLVGEENARKIMDDYFPRACIQGSVFFELTILRKDHEERTFSFSLFVTGESRDALGLIGSDITEIRKLELDLIAAKNQAEESNHAKSNFLSRMSHEMRTPMNAIIGMTSIAKSSNDPERKEYCLDKINDASKHLLGVINDILDMSKIEANKFELSYQEFELEKMLQRVTNVINFRVDEKDQDFIIKVDPRLPDTIVCDDQRLAQVVTNLLSNAVKFTPERGKITMEVELLSEPEEELCSIRISVKDTGIGITPEQQSKLFRSFEQADGGIARKFGGTGLGLAISKNIVGLMGGEIWVESEEGKGSNFRFVFPAQRGKGKKAKPEPDMHWNNLRVLAVDDSEDVREYFMALAGQIGFRCDTAGSGADALALIQGAEAAPYHIVFVDWRMPEMDGIELTQRIREATGDQTRVVMISATAWEEIEKEARSAGVDRFIPKPLFSSQLVNCINECLNTEQLVQDAKEEGSPYQNRFAGKHLLLAEDIEINREIVSALLENTGVAIDYAENGQEALDRFRANPGRYDMIFMDIHMPEMDGYEATRRIRALPVPEAATVPIVAMTANVFREDIERCLAAGMNSHVGKPIDLDEMLSRMDIYLNAKG